MRGIPHALGCSAYLSVWREVGALCVERLAVTVPSLPTLCFPLCISVTGACFSRGCGGSWLGCQVLPAIGAVSILELVASSGSSRMSWASNLQRATKLFNASKISIHHLVSMKGSRAVVTHKMRVTVLATLHEGYILACMVKMNGLSIRHVIGYWW